MHTEEFRSEMIEKIRGVLESPENQSSDNKEQVVPEKIELESEGEIKQPKEKEVENPSEEPQEVETQELESENEEKQELETNEESLLEIERKLSGHTKEFKDLVKSIKDPELQRKALEAGKISRAREDRFASELGEIKKQYESVSNFKRMLDSSPTDTILQIAKLANLDLKSLVEPTVAEEEYMLPEERALNNKMKNIEHQNRLLAKKLEKIENAKILQEQEAINQEIDDFASNTEKYPYFTDLQDTIAEILTIDKNKNGLPKNSQERISRLEKAYNKALLLDESLLKKRDEELVRKLENKRKADVEKAKIQKKVSTSYAKNPVSPATFKDEIIADLKRLGL